MIQKKIHKSILSVDLSGELSQLEEFFSEKFNQNGLMAIVGTHQYEFDLNLSSRMLNYYESNGFINFYREGSAGKRRFSLANALSFQFNMHLKETGFSSSEITEITKSLNEKGKNGYCDWDLIVYYASALIGLNELYIRFIGNAGAKADYAVNLTTKNSESAFNISKELRSTFFSNEQVKLLKNKTAAFLPRFIYEIDKVRNGFKLPLIAKDAFKMITQSGEKQPEKLLEAKDILSLNSLPIKLYERMYDIIHEDENGNTYGIEIKEIKVNQNIKLRCEMLTTNSEELLRAIQTEIHLLQRMKAKLAKDS